MTKLIGVVIVLLCGFCANAESIEVRKIDFTSRHNDPDFIRGYKKTKVSIFSKGEALKQRTCVLNRFIEPSSPAYSDFEIVINTIQ